MDARAVYFGAFALCHLGESGRGLEWADKTLIMDPEEPQVLYNVACVYAQFGDHDKAIDCIEQAIKHGWGQKEWMENDPQAKVFPILLLTARKVGTQDREKFISTWSRADATLYKPFELDDVVTTIHDLTGQAAS